MGQPCEFQVTIGGAIRRRARSGRPGGFGASKMHNLLLVASENDEIVSPKIIEEGVIALAKMQLAVSQGLLISV
jgi:hypothetical protein